MLHIKKEQRRLQKHLMQEGLPHGTSAIYAAAALANSNVRYPIHGIPGPVGAMDGGPLSRQGPVGPMVGPLREQMYIQQQTLLGLGGGGDHTRGQGMSYNRSGQGLGAMMSHGGNGNGYNNHQNNNHHYMDINNTRGGGYGRGNGGLNNNDMMHHNHMNGGSYRMGGGGGRGNGGGMSSPSSYGSNKSRYVHVHIHIIKRNTRYYSARTSLNPFFLPSLCLPFYSGTLSFLLFCQYLYPRRTFHNHLYSRLAFDIYGHPIGGGGGGGGDMRGFGNVGSINSGGVSGNSAGVGGGMNINNNNSNNINNNSNLDEVLLFQQQVQRMKEVGRISPLSTSVHTPRQGLGSGQGLGS